MWIAFILIGIIINLITYHVNRYIAASGQRAETCLRRAAVGGESINEVCIHMMAKGVPLNGTGHSGMGAYHGSGDSVNLPIRRPS